MKLVLDSADWIAHSCGVAFHETEGKEGTTVTLTSRMVYVSYKSDIGWNYWSCSPQYSPKVNGVEEALDT